MEIEFKEDKIIFDRELSLLDIFMLKMFLSKLKVSDNQVKRYLGDFNDN